MHRFQQTCVLVALGALAVAAVPTDLRRNGEQLCQCRPITSPKIVGGSIVEADVTYPWMASIGALTHDFLPEVMKSAAKTPEDAKRLSHVCGAIILNKDYVITTARCVKSLDIFMAAKPNLSISSFGVGFGKSLDAIHDAGRIPIAEVHVHPNYAAQTVQNLNGNQMIMTTLSKLFGNIEFDFAILKLNRSLQLSSEHGLLPACLETMDTSYYYEPLSTIGYGALVDKIDLVSMMMNQNFDKLATISGNELKKLNMQHLFMNTSNPWFAKTLDEISKIFENPTIISQLSADPSKFSEQRMYSWEQMIWATAASDEPVPSSICSGDAGGPLMYQQGGITKVVGIASDILSRMDGMTSILCDDKAFFARIYTALPWIREIVHDDLCLA